MFKKILIVLFFLNGSILSSNKPIIFHLKNSAKNTRNGLGLLPVTDFNYGDSNAKVFKIKKQITSFLAGFMAGATTGTACAILDRLMPQLLLSNWFFSWYTRSSLTDNFSYQLRQNKISHNKIEMENFAWGTSWFTYVLTLLKMQSDRT